MKLLVRTIDFCVPRSTEIFVSVQRQMALVRSFIKPERQLHLQINRIKAAATSVVTNWISTQSEAKRQQSKHKKPNKTKQQQQQSNTNKPKKSTVGGQLISS